MKRVCLIALSAASICAASTTANARDADVLTESNAVLCASASSLREANVAAARGDIKWLISLSCLQARGGVHAILISPETPLAYPWQVRINMLGHDMTLWGDASAFRTKSGKKFWPPNYHDKSAAPKMPK